MKYDKEDILEALGIEEGGGLWAALAGFGVGCLVGAAAAVLLSPKSGRELRHDIVERGREMMGRAREAAGKVEEQAKQTF